MLGFFSGTAHHGLYRRNLLKSKHKVLCLSQNVPYLLEKKKNPNPFTKRSSKTSGRGWMEIEPGVSPILFLWLPYHPNKPASEKEKLAHTTRPSLLALTVEWSRASHVSFWVAVSSSVKGNVKNNIRPAYWNNRISYYFQVRCEELGRAGTWNQPNLVHVGGIFTAITV